MYKSHKRALRRVSLNDIRVTLDFPPLTDISEHAVIQAAVFIEDAAQVIWLKKCFLTCTCHSTHKYWCLEKTNRE